MKGIGAKPQVRELVVAGLFSLCALLLVTRPALAADPVVEESLTSVEVHGFVSQGFILTWRNEYLARDSTQGSFEFAEVGINFTKRLTEKLELGVQLFAQDFGPTGDYTPRFDWFYADYRWQDWLGLRVGRLKIPYGLHNEIFDVDAARVHVLLPGSVYPSQNRETLFSQTGMELYGFARSPSLGALDYRLFLGTMFFDPDSLTPAGTQLELDFHVPYVFGVRVLWEAPLEGLRVGGSVQKLRLQPTFFIPAMAPILVENESWLWVASAEYSIGELMLTAEYSRWHTEQSSNTPALSPAFEVINERAYAMATYRLTPWLHPGAYYSLFYPWPGGRVIYPADLVPSSVARGRFSREVLRRSVAAVKAYWQQRIFSGRGVPPPQFPSEDGAVAYVLKYDGAVAYVSGATDLEGAKELPVSW